MPGSPTEVHFHVSGLHAYVLLHVVVYLFPYVQIVACRAVLCRALRANVRPGWMPSRIEMKF